MEPERLWNRRYTQLVAIELMLQMGGFLTRPIISNYAISLGATVPVAGFLAGMLATAALCIRPVSGMVSDRFSKKTLLVLACALFSLGAFGCALARSVVLMGAFLALQGFAFAFKSALVTSFVPAVVPANRIGAGVGWLGLAYTVAIALGPSVGLAVSEIGGYPAAFAASGCLLLAAFVLAVLFDPPVPTRVEGRRPDRPPSRRPVLRTLFYPPAVLLSLVGGTLMISQGITSSFVILAGEMRGISSVSLYFVFYALANVGARPLAGWASDTLGVRRVVPPMMVVAIVGMLALAFLDNIAGVVVGGLCMGLGQGSAYAAIQAESVRDVPPECLARSANTYFIGPDIGMGLGPVFGGAILQSSGPEAMYLFNAVTIAAALALFVIATEKTKRARP
ncbi:MFS transporter [Adlercreutzia sp. R25]|uniref:MFS transporter n=1 Tax=Adlercreutzia shanghongiae TaxID=3111773 RepID=A0ABU6IXB1_9ACTN|nr:MULTISPECIES: MFS transporter [unclassified Adlercreutzia]MEC4272669.1 MFS transporter [Adlercreutzia sp. R25]MEC4294430.1 MFS transporter [Adlercreutzia sp. R22]